MKVENYIGAGSGASRPTPPDTISFLSCVIHAPPFLEKLSSHYCTFTVPLYIEYIHT
jgi:hypothetical protein